MLQELSRLWEYSSEQNTELTFYQGRQIHEQIYEVVVSVVKQNRMRCRDMTGPLEERVVQEGLSEDVQLHEETV